MLYGPDFEPEPEDEDEGPDPDQFYDELKDGIAMGEDWAIAYARKMGVLPKTEKEDE